MIKYKNSRFALIFLVIFIFLSVNCIERIFLFLISINQVNLNIIYLIKMFLIGFVYDVIACTYFIAPFAVYISLIPNKIFNSRIHKYFVWFLILFQLNLIIFTAFSEYFFWNEFGKRFNFIAVDYLVYTHEVIHNILESYPIPLLSSIMFIFSLFIFYLIYNKTYALEKSFACVQPFRQRLVILMIFLILPFISFNLFDAQPLANVSPNQYNNELAKNGIYSIFSAFRHNTLDYEEFYKALDIRKLLVNLKRLTGLNEKMTKFVQNTGKEKKYNIILIMVESLSAKYMGIFGNTQGLTPFLDKLATESMFFDNFYATGTRTVRGMEAVILSVPPTPGRSIIKRPDCHNMFSAGFIFKNKGYENKFIYAGYGYFDNMNDFFSHNGFTVVDRTDFTKEEITFANAWGACDEDLFNKVLKETDKSYNKNKHFFNFIMTTSNHRPYTYPNGKIDIPSHTGRTGAVKYTDYAIHEFIEKAKKKPWFKNTIFIIVADHNGKSAGKTDLPVWRYKIPLILYAPYILTPTKISKLSNQVDIMPTVFDIMNWSYKSKFYGNSILKDDFKERAFIGTYQKLGFLRNKKLVVLEPDKTVHEYKIVEQTLTGSKYKEIKPFTQDEFDAITFYQSASYFYKEHLDKW